MNVDLTLSITGAIFPDDHEKIQEYREIVAECADVTGGSMYCISQIFACSEFVRQSRSQMNASIK